jgi:hypothetical protein
MHTSLTLVALLAVACFAAPGCSEGDDDCPGGTIVDRESECYQDTSCVRLSSGRYCSGGGESDQCPEHWEQVAECPEEPVFWCIDYSLSQRCQLGELSPQACEQAGGDPIGDPGDGSVSTVGCPNQRRPLGFVVPGGIEGTLCCQR